MTEEIKNLGDWLAHVIGPDKTVISSNVSRLIAPGENYCNLVLKVDATLSNKVTGQEEEFCGVAKCLNRPKENQEHNVTEFEKENYISEVSFYKEIVPTLTNFAEQNGLELNIFPRLIAFRPNAHGTNDEVDYDSVLLFENLGVEGFRNMDRHVGFGCEDAQVILKDLALFHAVPVALKLKRPHSFESKIKENLKRIPFAPPEPKEGEDFKWPLPLDEVDVYIDILQNYDGCKLYIESLRNEKENYDHYIRNMREIATKKPKSEPFASIFHNDMWLNNTMQVVEEGKIVKNKFVDFQLHQYDSPVQDLIFFMGTSVQLPVIKKHFDTLVKCYHNSFLEFLERLGCETNSFNCDKFDEEMRKSAGRSLLDVFMFNSVVFGKKGEAKSDTKKPFQKEEVTEIMRERAATLVHIFGKRGWI